jgi:dihydrolipoamide dehydrogenase
MDSFDVAVIGTGPGGYVCAIRAAQLGMRVAVIEKRATHGGTCLNIGCIPSKALLHASELFHDAGTSFAKMGIETGRPTLDLPRMMAFKQEAVEGNTKGVEFLFRKNRITAFHGTARIVRPGEVAVKSDNGETTSVAARSIIIATGSDSAELKGVEVDEKRIVSSTGALTLDRVPRDLLVVGAGVIGLELGSVWARLGAKVTVVEFLDRIVPGIDAEVAKQFQRLLQRQDFTFRLSSKVTGVTPASDRLSVMVEPAKGGPADRLESDIVLVAIGRVPYSSGLGLDELGVQLDNKRRITVTDRFESTVPGIFAIGDVIRGPMLAHKAEDEGIALAELLAGQAGHVNYDVIPNVIYTSPEVATVGRSEEELKRDGIAYKVGKFPFLANGRAKANQTTDGFVKIIADAATDRVLGAHILGPQAGELIHECAVLMEFGGSSEDLARTCHAHPTLAEAVKEAAMAVEQRAIHM